MNTCTNCEKELSSEIVDTQSDTSSNSNKELLSSSKRFWILLVSAVCVCVFSLFNWLQIDNIGFNQYILWSKLNSFVPLFGSSQAFTAIYIITILLTVLLLSALSLLIISLIKFQKKKSGVLACIGFWLFAFIAAVFIVVITSLNGGMQISGLTIFPVLTLTFAVIGMIFVGDNSILSAAPKRKLHIGLSLGIAVLLIPLMIVLIDSFLFAPVERQGKVLSYKGDEYIETNAYPLIGEFEKRIGLLRGTTATVYAPDGDNDNFLLLSDFLDSYVYVKVGYEIPRSGTVTAVCTEFKIITRSPDEIDLFIRLSQFSGEEYSFSTENINRDGQDFNFAYNNCPIEGERIGYILYKDGMWLFTKGGNIGQDDLFAGVGYIIDDTEIINMLESPEMLEMQPASYQKRNLDSRTNH